MYKIKSILFFTGIICLLVSCSTSDKSTDFTAENLFTQGIEGPAVDSEGNLYAVNFEREGTIGIVDMQGNASLYLTLPNGSVGNGIRFDRDDTMYIADYVNHNVLFVAQGSKDVNVYAHDPELNQPNEEFLKLAQRVIKSNEDPTGGCLYALSRTDITKLGVPPGRADVAYGEWFFFRTWPLSAR